MTEVRGLNLGVYSPERLQYGKLPSTRTMGA